jgi:succinate dehydrogenase / fumarate reductase, cytochrome b subunit
MLFLILHTTKSHEIDMAQAANYGLLKSSIGKKVFMALTGLFLCLFLVGHLAGNLQLFIGGEEGKLQFNAYAKFMTTNPAVKILSYVTYISVLFHVIDGIVLTVRNRKARPVQYHYKRDSDNSIWSSRNMGILGTVILAFIILHMANFWYKMHFGEIPNDSAGNRDLHEVVMQYFTMPWAVALYVISMIAIGFHLWHGFSSAFQSLGANHPGYMPLIRNAGKAFSVLVPLLFALIPVYIYLTNL